MTNKVALKEFEKEIIQLLAKGKIADQLIDEICNSLDGGEYEFSGAGYFLNIQHPNLPIDRIVCDTPFLNGHANGIDTGYILFIQDQELLFECYDFMGDFPKEYREWDVKVSITSENQSNKPKPNLRRTICSFFKLNF